MKSKIYIPKKINVGFQSRNDTYTKQLGYIIYWDDKGVLRKESSWTSWRDKKIEPQEFDNVPHSGFVLNKSVKRDSSYFGNGRNMIRIYDDRGFEFEITTGNLLFILMTTNCHKRGLEGEFVYAWDGSELVLLPTGCEEYEVASKFTIAKESKTSAKELILGASYMTKDLTYVVYMGKFDYYQRKYTQSHGKPMRQNKKDHIFYDESNDQFTPLPIAKIAECTNPEPINDYNKKIDKMKKKIEFSRIVGWRISDTDFISVKNSYYSSYYVTEEEDRLVFWKFVQNHNHYATDAKFVKDCNYYISKKDSKKDDLLIYNKANFERNIHSWHYQTTNAVYPDDWKHIVSGVKTKTFSSACPVSPSLWNTYTHRSEYNIWYDNELKKIKIPQLYVIFENGKEMKVKNNDTSYIIFE